MGTYFKYGTIIIIATVVRPIIDVFAALADSIVKNIPPPRSG